MNEYSRKLRSIAAPRRLGQSNRKVEKADGSMVIHEEHWDGSQDATVRPATVRYGARTHGMGRRKGEIAEVIPLTRKERKERHGDEV